jgi:hypothetical protein
MKFLSLLILLLNSSIAFAKFNEIKCENTIKFSNYKGMTYLSFMQEVIKPTLDVYATEGYQIADTAQIKKTLSVVSSKVKRVVLRASKGEENLYKIIDQISGVQTNLYDLPKLIASVDNKVNRYKLSTFIGLASCGGAVIEFAPSHFAYNIHYGTGKISKDNRTGRSFGEGIVRKADDASDKNYLKDLEEFGHKHKDSIDPFYNSLILSLLNSDAKEMEGISDFGKLLLTDFLAVYTAEQARNLMDNKIHTHWDAALLEVTLLGAFHAGQDKVKLFYKDPNTKKSSFTSTVFNQDNGCSIKDRKQRDARVYDYWQFSSSQNPEHCKRSGINITKYEFRRLSKLITKYYVKYNKKLIEKIANKIGANINSKSLNIFNQLSKFLINDSTEKSFDEKFSQQLASDFVNFLRQVRLDAKKISRLIESGELK